MHSNITLNAAQFAVATANADKRMLTIRVYAKPSHAHRTPRALIQPLTRGEWAALSPDQRLAHLRQHAHEQAQERVRAVIARTLQLAPVAVPLPLAEPATDTLVKTPSPISQTHPDGVGYFVQCAGGCGRWLPTNSPKPTLRYCLNDEWRRRAVRRRRSRRGQ